MMGDRTSMIAMPNWMMVEEDGAVSATWCYGKQGADDSWRITMLWQPEEGFCVFTSRRENSRSVMGDAAGPFLKEMVDEMTAQRQGKDSGKP